MPDATPPTHSIRLLVQDSMAEMSNAERKVARTLLSRYPSAALTTVANLASEAGVSAPTVLRFATRLGYSGFLGLQRALVEELNEQGSPLRQYETKRSEGASDSILSRTGESFSALLTTTYAGVPESEFSAVAAILADPGKRILAAGGRFSSHLAGYMVHHLQLLRPSVEAMPQDEIAQRSAVLSTNTATVLIIFDYRRYAESSWALAAEMHRRGAVICLMTDNGLSPISGLSKHVLPAHVDNASPFDSIVAATAITESLIAAVTDLLADEGMARVAQFEEHSGVSAHELGEK